MLLSFYEEGKKQKFALYIIRASLFTEEITGDCHDTIKFFF